MRYFIFSLMLIFLSLFSSLSIACSDFNNEYISDSGNDYTLENTLNAQDNEENQQYMQNELQQQQETLNNIEEDQQQQLNEERYNEIEEEGGWR